MHHVASNDGSNHIAGDSKAAASDEKVEHFQI
jgi:hypothetical protein